jgi:hypothetical protein
MSLKCAARAVIMFGLSTCALFMTGFVRLCSIKAGNLGAMGPRIPCGRAASNAEDCQQLPPDQIKALASYLSFVR